MPIIEGIGDEVLASFGISLLIAVATLAWYSTRVRPLLNGGAVYVVQIEESSANRRVLQVLSLDENTLHNENTNLSQLLSSTPLQNQPLPGAAIAPPCAEDSNSSDSSTDSAALAQCPAGPRAILTSTTSEALHENVGVPKRDLVHEKERSSSRPEVSRENLQKKTIRIKFFDDTQKIASVWLSETVGDFIRQNFHDETQRGQIIRLIYRGQLLSDDAKSLASYGLHDNCVLHCHLTSSAARATNATTATPSNASARQPSTSGSTSDGSLNLGRFVYAIFGLNFAMLWLLCALFWQYISLTALAYLAFCTAVYCTFLYRRIFGTRRVRSVD